MTNELARVVVRLAVGAPEAALAPATAPIAPDPLTPDGSAPTKLTTVIVAAADCDRVAVMVAPLIGFAAKERQISDVPFCPLARPTSSHVSPPPETLFTVVFAPPR